MQEGDPQDWSVVNNGLDHGGYVAWEAAHDTPASKGKRRLVPVFARLCRPADAASMTLREAIAASLALSDVAFSQHERDLLETDSQMAGRDDWPFEVRLVAWCPRALLASPPPYWEVLHVGPSVLMDEVPPTGPRSPPDGRALPRGNGVARAPVLAVIDDGIAFLNTRFRKNLLHSRMAAIWLHAPERVIDDAISGRDDVLCGRVLTAAEIDAALQSGGTEAEYYGQLSRWLRPGERVPTNHRVAHGTHVLDLAAGADPWRRDPIGDVPLLAVQLPPAAIRETSGRRLEGYVVQGLRWLLAQTLILADGGAVPPLVINLSIGSLAGSGDKTAFLADWMRHELDRHARLAPKAEVRIVAAYGNAYRDRLVARARISPAAPLRLDWRILPDDHTASFLELRVPAALTAGLALTLAPPAGSGLKPRAFEWPDDGTGWRLGPAKGPLAAIVATREGDHALLHLTIAATAGLGPAALAPPGCWRVDLASTGSEPVVTARVQRDDTPSSYRTLGRQSWLDHPSGWDWDSETRDHTAPCTEAGLAGCPVTRQGTAAAFAGADHPCILFVGAVRGGAKPPGTPPSSRYSASGAGALCHPGESVGPTLAACGDDGALTAGRRASGVLSGSVARLSGTSMSAPLVARRLLMYFLTTPPAKRSAAAEEKALLGKPSKTVSPRIGKGVLVA